MLPSLGIITDLAAHLAAVALFVAVQHPAATTPFRNGSIVQEPKVGDVQFFEAQIPDLAGAASSTAIEEPPVHDDRQEARGYKFGELTEAQAKALQGKRIAVRLRIGEEIVGHDRQTAYRCKGNESADYFVCFVGGKALDVSLTDGRELMVEGKLLMEAALKVGNKPGYPAQFVLTDARIVGR